MGGFNKGDLVTIWDTTRHGQNDRPVGLAKIQSVGARVVKTGGGRRWNTKRGHEVDERLAETGSFVIRAYQKNDEKRIARERRLGEARKLLNGYEWEIRRDFALLSDEDLDALAGISSRLNDARKARDTAATIEDVKRPDA